MAPSSFAPASFVLLSLAARKRAWERSRPDRSSPDSFLPVRSTGVGFAARILASTSARVISAVVISGEVRSTCRIMSCAAATADVTLSIPHARATAVCLPFRPRHNVSPRLSRISLPAGLRAPGGTEVAMALMADMRGVLLGLAAAVAVQYAPAQPSSTTIRRRACRLRFRLHEDEWRDAAGIGAVFLLDRCYRIHPSV